MTKPSSAVIVVIASLAMASCALNAPVGAWDLDSRERYVGWAFAPGGQCNWIVVDKKATVGLGSWCSYSYDAATGIITITELYDKHERFTPEKPMLLKYDRLDDAVVSPLNEDASATLQRAITLKWIYGPYH